MPVRIHTLCLDLQNPTVYSWGYHIEYVTLAITMTQCLLSGKVWHLVIKLHWLFRTGIFIELLVLFIM